jgi:hypothetical protein
MVGEGTRGGHQPTIVATGRKAEFPQSDEKLDDVGQLYFRRCTTTNTCEQRLVAGVLSSLHVWSVYVMVLGLHVGVTVVSLRVYGMQRG